MKLSASSWLKTIAPGFCLSIGVAIISKVLAQWVPQLGAATLAILLGILLGNTLFRQPVLAQGTKLAESKLLEFSVVLLGLTVTFQTIADLGLASAVFILLQMTLTIFAAYMLGRKLGFSMTFSLLMAGGNAVCGSSAIASIAPSVGATEEEKGQSITLVNLLGTVMMLTLPILSVAVFGTAALSKSALLGGTLQSVGQVVASASMLDTLIVQTAMLFKIMRIMLLVVVVFVFQRFSQARTPAAAAVASPKKRLPVPWYVIGFLLCCILNSSVQLPAVIHESSSFISSWFEITALAAIGLRLDFAKFIKEGPRFLLYGLATGSIQVIGALVLISLLRIH